MKKLVLDKMEKDLMPNLKENIIEDFYLTPDYFEKDLNTIWFWFFYPAKIYSISLL